MILERNIDPFHILENTILEQISERYLLENEPSKLSEKARKNFDNDWSNPDPYPYFQTAMYVMYDEKADVQRKERGQADLDWTKLAAILSIGQV